MIGSKTIINWQCLLDVQIFANIVALFVTAQFSMKSKIGRTLFTLICIITNVRSCMFDQFVALAKSTITVCAFVWFLTGVREHVLFQRRCLTKSINLK